MIDLHAHILPGLDDGASNLDESAEMCLMAGLDGVRTIVATPHTGNGTYDNNRTRIIAAVRELSSYLKQKGVSVEILPGADTYIHAHLDRRILDGHVLTINDNMRYVMVEFPKHAVPPNLIEWLFRMTLAGFVPVLTHPERNTALSRKLDIVREWVEKGGLVQLTAMSLTGAFGQKIRECSEELLQRNLVHVIASDAHSSTRRPPLLSEAVERAASLVGPVYARTLVEDNPAAIIAGAPFAIPAPIEKKKHFFLRWLQGKGVSNCACSMLHEGYSGE